MINFRKKAVAMLLAAVFTAGMLSGCGTSGDTEKSKNDSRKAVEQTTQAEADTNSKAQNEEDKSESIDIFAMDTYMTLTAYGKNAKKALDAAVDEINNIEQLVSTGIDSSEVSQINKNGKGSVSETTGYLIKRSKEIYDSTNGAFDITIYPIMQAWGFPTENYRVPGKKELKKLRGLMGADHVLYDEKKQETAKAIATAVLGTLSDETIEQPLYYRVQTGAFRRRENADQMLYQLTDQGFPGFLLYENNLYKVQVGAFQQINNAIQMEQKLRDAGYSTIIVTK